MIAEPMKAWQCIGCGRIELPQPCVGVCQDRRVEIAYYGDLQAAHARIEALEAVVRKIATTTPNEGQAARTWTALQGQAREALGK